MASFPKDLTVPHGPHSGKTISVPSFFYDHISNSDDQDLLIVILSLVLPSQKRNKIHVEVHSNEAVIKLLFFNGHFDKQIQNNISTSFSDVWIKLSNYVNRFSIEQTLSDFPVYYDTDITSKETRIATSYAGCLVVEVRKNWKLMLESTIQEIDDYKDKTSNNKGIKKANRIMTNKTGKINKSSTKFQLTERTVDTVLKQRSFGAKILDKLLGVDESSIRSKVLNEIDN